MKKVITILLLLVGVGLWGATQAKSDLTHLGIINSWWSALTGSLTGIAKFSSGTIGVAGSGDSFPGTAADSNKVKGGTPPTSATVVGTNSSGQLVDASDVLIMAGCSRLKALSNVGTPTTSVDITADMLAVTDGSTYKKLTSVSVTVSCAGTGANGLDTGSLSAGNWYYFYIIAKADGTVAGLASLSATAPAMPSGYTYKKLVSAQYYVTTSFRGFVQNGNIVNITDSTVSMFTCLVNTWTSTSIAAYVPPNAIRVIYQPYQTSGASIMFEVGWDNTGKNLAQFIVPVAGATLDGSYGGLGIQRYCLNPAAPQTIYIKGYDTSMRGGCYLMGYELDM